MAFWVPIVLSYLLGSIPFGLLIARSRGVDIRKEGSGNIGATNVMRVVGKGLGITTLVLDACKGLVSTILLPMIMMDVEMIPVWLRLACGCAAIFGHSFPLYLKFKGGKGVATSAGVLIGVAPAAFGFGIGVFAILFAVFRYVSLGSICASIVVPVASYFLYREGLAPDVRTYVLCGLGLIVIWRHKENIKRLLHGTENRITFGRKATKSTSSQADGEE